MTILLIFISIITQVIIEIFALSLVYIPLYYMALSHKDWELPNSRIWLAEIDIDRGLDFSI